MQASQTSLHIRSFEYETSHNLFSSQGLHPKQQATKNFRHIFSSDSDGKIYIGGHQHNNVP